MHPFIFEAQLPRFSVISIAILFVIFYDTAFHSCIVHDLCSIIFWKISAPVEENKMARVPLSWYWRATLSWSSKLHITKARFRDLPLHLKFSTCLALLYIFPLLIFCPCSRKWAVNCQAPTYMCAANEVRVFLIIAMKRPIEFPVCGACLIKYPIYSTQTMDYRNQQEMINVVHIYHNVKMINVRFPLKIRRNLQIFWFSLVTKLLILKKDLWKAWRAKLRSYGTCRGGHVRDVGLHAQERGWARGVTWIAGRRRWSRYGESPRRGNVTIVDMKTTALGCPGEPCGLCLYQGEFCVIKEQTTSQI